MTFAPPPVADLDAASRGEFALHGEFLHDDLAAGSDDGVLGELHRDRSPRLQPGHLLSFGLPLVALVPDHPSLHDDVASRLDPRRLDDPSHRDVLGGRHLHPLQHVA